MIDKVDQCKAGIILAGLALFLPAGIVAKQSMAVIFILLVIAMVILTLLKRPSYLLPNKYVAVLFFILCGYTLFTHSTIISCKPCDYQAIVKLPMLGLVLWVASSRMAFIPSIEYRKLTIFLLIGLGIALAYLAFELATDALIYRYATERLNDPSVSLSRYNRGTSALIILIWPFLALAFIKNNRRLGILLLAGVIILAGIGDSSSAMVSSLLACFAAFLAYLMPLVTFRLVAIISVSFTICVPIIFLVLLGWLQPIANQISPSTLDRLEIWHRLATAVIDAPLFGHGIGVTRYLSIPPELSQNYKYFFVPTTHPHNAPIQIWLELGAIGISLMVLLIWLTTLPMRSLAGFTRIAALAASVAIIFTGFVSYGFWQETWLSIIGATVIYFKLIAHASIHRGDCKN